MNVKEKIKTTELEVGIEKKNQLQRRRNVVEKPQSQSKKLDSIDVRL